MMEPKTEITHISTPKAHYTLDLNSGTIRAKPIITNADRIRAMGDEELAEYIYRILENVNGNLETCPSLTFLKQWLSQEAY